MKREMLLLDNIKRDLHLVLKRRSSVTLQYYLSLLMILCILGIVLIHVTALDRMGGLFLILAVYCLCRLLLGLKDYYCKRAAICHATFSDGLICMEEAFGHIALETIPEKRYSFFQGRFRCHTTVPFMFFASGRSWRLTPSSFGYYAWSKDYSLSRKGLENTSLMGDLYYHILLAADNEIAYVYPAKYFMLKEGLGEVFSSDETENEDYVL